jgi:cob(I)alamin adenosyltransferase
MDLSPRDGLFHLYHGPGKGKTTAALGAVARAAGHEMDCRVFQFFKGDPDRHAGEVAAMRSFDTVSVDRYPTAHVREGRELTDEERDRLEGGLADAEAALGGGTDVVVLDEVTALWSLEVVEADRLVGLLEGAAPGTEVLCTGREAPNELVDAVHYCSYVGDVKHPFRAGVDGRPGIEW